MKTPSVYTHEGEAHDWGYRAGINADTGESLLGTRLSDYQDWYDRGYALGLKRRQRIKDFGWKLGQT